MSLIQGSIAEREGLHRISSNPGKLRVGSGMEIDTVYGIYKVHLGPTDSGEYLEVTCRGLPILTEGFSEHSLAELNKEVYQTGIIDRSVLLPRILGGASVGILMGITSTKTDPVLEYLSPMA